MKAILQKLYGNNKRSTSVKQALREVKLSKINDLLVEIDDKIIETKQQLNEVLNSGYVNKASGAIDSAMTLGGAVLSDIEIIVNQIEGLGIDIPDQVVELQVKADKLFNLKNIENNLNNSLSNTEDILIDIKDSL